MKLVWKRIGNNHRYTVHGNYQVAGLNSAVSANVIGKTMSLVYCNVFHLFVIAGVPVVVCADDPASGSAGSRCLNYSGYNLVPKSRE
jgi:hypothetical protein